MSYGLHLAGIQMLGGVDLDPDCKKTYEANIPNARFFQSDITKLTKRQIGEFFGIDEENDDLVFCGCSPCQFWSKVRTNRRKSRRTAFLLRQFERFISYFRPGFIVVENVPGLRNKKNHTILPQFLSFLKKNGYVYKDTIVNAVDYGVPQHRLRYLLLATRLHTQIRLPRRRNNTSLTVKRFIQGLTPLSAGQQDPADYLHKAAGLSEKNAKRLARTPNDGGDRSSWRDDSDLQLPAYKSKDDIFRDVYGRMFWERAAPTITTRFNSLSNGRFGHPEQHRAISLREGAILQTFPRSFYFHGSSQVSIARQIGNAVPPALAQRIGKHIMKISANG